ncbi:hypothetical protein A2954_03580 [Candidatus Roizmanbacteria bacterium RIFCSPLOWO2_01_FULL_37_12]|uniref:UDP-N-acetylglucosamine--N-acetylmuramyl-(pentapeptide) pyrophosphoryl-undecaprenol N-acetylglucosamine transferase n=1 Tax=Candidatus Roizmanbacteria bacterium RIFCSPLOWO2_01_FULL_37_12 TaxID=1802056 RepID=A0A1F7IEI3_9BACT|nr:MAG: hypothetical protein A2954_03580 [Candidatus Roizmanbacteria bacterium RIFCSPLOWO2_01_FULL_37_12]
MKILITGGHLGPALAVIDEIGNQADLVFVGRKFDLDREKTYSLEYQEIAKKNIRFYNLQTGRITRLLSLKLILNLIKIPLGLYQSLVILLNEKPSLILSFGGYIGFPICLTGFILKIPIFSHEQTLKPGLTNRLTGILAKKIFLAFPETKKFFPASKVIVCGNPVRKTVLGIRKIPFKIEKTKPLIYVTGGSIGSHSVNVHIENILQQLLEKYIVIHQTGKISKYADYRRLIEKRKKLPENLKKNYYLREHFLADEIGSIYSLSDLVVGRSGANTVFELIAWKKPAVLIPLPWSANREQLEHAKLMQKSGVSDIFLQSKSSNHLLLLIEKTMANITNYKNNFKNVQLLYKENAAKIIVKTILSQSVS